MRLLGNIWRWLRVLREISRLPRSTTAHVLAEPNTLLSYQLGDRCIYFSARPRDVTWHAPCPRKIPDSWRRELA